MKSHGTEKPFQCQTCPRKFASAKLLELHEPVHLCLQPFRCQQCNRSYNFEEDLRRHVQAKHND